MKRLTCKNKKCGYSWIYKGNAKFYATCPCCLGKVKLKVGGKNE